MKEYVILNKLIFKMKQEYDMSKCYNLYACIVDKKGNILSIGKNSYIKTHPVQYKYNLHNPEKIFLHAEIDALLKCKSDNYHTMIICRMTKLCNITMAKPCIGCMKALKDYNIKKVYYTDNQGNLVLLNF